jgi:hypothetical protein
MKASRWATLVLLLLLPSLFACVHFCRRSKGPYSGGSDCAQHPQRADCRVRLGLGPVSTSVRDDGSLAVAIPIVNSGDYAAAAVNVTKITVGAAQLLAPAALPAPLGEILPQHRGVLQARLASLVVPGSYTLTVSGVYIDRGASYPFTATAGLGVARPAQGPAHPAHAVVPKYKTSGIALKPSPIERENELNDLLGPPVPAGPALHPFAIAPNHTGPVKAPSPGAGPGMSVTFTRDTGTGQPTGWPPDPSTAAASKDGVVLATANTYLLFSQDDGQTFTNVDPTTIFPQSDGGLCCDQVVIYDRDVDLFFWVLQYKGSPNRLRVAFAHPADVKTNVNGWGYFDLTQATFNSGGGLDYPDLAVTHSFLYLSVGGSDAAGTTGGQIVARMPLSDITAGSSVGVTYIGPNETGDQARAVFGRLTQGSPAAMYWAGHVDTSHLEVFHWADGASTVDLHVTAVDTWCNSDFTTLAPDGQQWLDNLRAAGTGSVVAATYKPGSGQTAGHGEVWLGWTAGRDSAGCTQGRPQPYVKIARIDDTTLDSVGEYHIWNTPYAFAYPSLATSPAGDIGVSVAFGGPGDFASTTVGYLGDFVVYYVEASDLTLTFPLNNPDGTALLDSAGNPVLGTRFGDMFAVRRSGPDDSLFSSEGYAYKFVDATQSTSCAVAPGCTFRTHYEQWGRGGKP